MAVCQDDIVGPHGRAPDPLSARLPRGLPRTGGHDVDDLPTLSGGGGDTQRNAPTSLAVSAPGGSARDSRGSRGSRGAVGHARRAAAALMVGRTTAGLRTGVQGQRQAGRGLAQRAIAGRDVGVGRQLGHKRAGDVETAVRRGPPAQSQSLTPQPS